MGSTEAFFAGVVVGTMLIGILVLFIWIGYCMGSSK